MVAINLILKLFRTPNSELELIREKDWRKYEILYIELLLGIKILNMDFFDPFTKEK